MTSRRQARRQALFLVYQWDLSEGEIGAQYGGEIDPWARELAEETVARAAELDARITAASEGWTADRLGVVERSALRVAIRELDRGGGAAGGRDRRGGRLREAVRVRGRGQPRQRDSRPDPARGASRSESRDESLGRAEELLARLEAAREKLESTDDPDQAIEVLQELSDLAKQIEVELQAARRAAEADAADA